MRIAFFLARTCDTNDFERTHNNKKTLITSILMILHSLYTQLAQHTHQHCGEGHIECDDEIEIPCDNAPRKIACAKIRTKINVIDISWTTCWVKHFSGSKFSMASAHSFVPFDAKIQPHYSSSTLHTNAKHVLLVSIMFSFLSHIGHSPRAVRENVREQNTKKFFWRADLKINHAWQSISGQDIVWNFLCNAKLLLLLLTKCVRENNRQSLA